MGRLKFGWVGCIVLGSLPLAVEAQVPLTLNPTSPQTPGSTVIGVGAVDMIQLRGTSLSIPLKYAAVIEGSEQVYLNGRQLRRGDDYSLDCPSGVLSLMIPQKPGDSVRVQYRYDKSKTSTGTTGGIPTLRFDLLGNGGLGVIAGLGMAERTTDGRVITSNIFGFNNSMSLGGGGAVKGLFLYSDRQKVDSQTIDPSVIPGGPRAKVHESQHSKLILQSFNTKMLGGVIEANYQEIGSSFTGFGSVRSNGYDQAAVDQMQKEKGLTRMGFGFKDIGFGGLKFSDGTRSVKFGNAGITWQNMGFKMGGLSLDWNTQKVDSKFTRFKDLAETDRDQLAKEGGLQRANFAAGFTQGKQALGYNTFKVEDATGHSIERREFTVKDPKFGLSLGTQSFDPGFTRLGSLTPAEQQQYRLDTGLKRRWEDLTLGFLGAKATPFHFNTYKVESQTGEFTSQDISLGFKGFSMVHSERNIDSGFRSVGNLQPGEIDASVANIANAYDPTLKPTPQDRAMFVAGSGIDRSTWQFLTQPLKGWSAGFTTMRLKGTQDTAGLDVFSLTGKNFCLNYQHEAIGNNFHQLNSLMTFEQRRLGLLPGLTKTDLSLDTKIAGAKISFNQMSANSPLGAADRRALAITSKNFDLTVSSRGVDKGFTNVNQLVDPEKDILFALIGQKGTDAKLKWRPWKTMSIDAQSIDQTGNGLDQNRKYRNINVLWNPNKRTELGYQYLNDQSDDPMQLLYYKKFERFTLKEEIGKSTVFKFATEKEQLAGSNNANPGENKTYLSLQTDLSKFTKFFSERTETHFDNGTQQTITTNTISTQISPKAGVSLTDVRTDNPGDTADQSHRDYGLWFVLPNGMKLSYGDVRNTVGDASEETKNIGVTPGTLGNLKVDSATYTDHSWDTALDPHTKAQSNVSLSTVKPFHFGPLSDMHFSFGFNSLADRGHWQQENRLLGISSKLGTNSLAFEYKGQMWTNGYRAIDRTFRFATDTKPTRLLSASLFYKVRTLPWDAQVMIRDISFTLRPMKNLELSNHMITNPDVPNGNALLGSTAQPGRTNEWKLDYKKDPNFSYGAQWLETINDQSHALTRTGGIQCTLFNAKGSPLKLFYGLQQVQGNVPRSSQFRYSIQFDQRAGPNQSFSFFISNLNYANAMAQGLHRNNWTARADYNFRF